MKHYLGIAFLLLGLISCSWIKKGPPSGDSAMNQEAIATLNSLVSAIKSFDSVALASMVSHEYSDSLGRSRLQLMDSLRQDRDTYLAVEVSVFSVYAQAQNGGAVLRFDFTWRGTPKVGAEKKLKGQQEWVLQSDETGSLKLLKTSGTNFIGVP